MNRHGNIFVHKCHNNLNLIHFNRHFCVYWFFTDLMRRFIINFFLPRLLSPIYVFRTLCSRRLHANKHKSDCPGGSKLALSLPLPLSPRHKWTNNKITINLIRFMLRCEYKSACWNVLPFWTLHYEDALKRREMKCENCYQKRTISMNHRKH